MSKKITLVFYENPAALHNLFDWEQQMTRRGELLIKEKHHPDIIEYQLPRKNEVLLCYPTTFLNYSRIMKDFSKQLGNYHKTLLFGKFEANQLEFILRVMSTFNYVPKPHHTS